MWKKIIYFAFAVVMGMIFYMIIYSANLSDHKSLLVNQAIENKEYHVVPQIFLEVPFDTKSIIETNDEDAVVEIYPASGVISYTYYVGEETKTYSRYEKAYLFFIFESKISVNGYTDSANKYVNNSAIRFAGEKGTYDFYFVQDETYNANSYIAEPKNELEYSLNGSRDLAAIQNDWKFVPLSISETTIKYIEQQYTGTISSFQIVDALGEVKLEQNVSFSFNESFYSHEFIAKTYTEVNTLLDKYYSTTDSKEQNNVSDQISTYLETFKTSFKEKTEGTGYAMTLSDEVLNPGSVYWKTIA